VKTPYDYQVTGVEQLANNKRFGLFWSMGTGKTFTTLLAAKKLGYPSIVVCPEGAKLAWEEENQEVDTPLEYYNYTSFHKLTEDQVKGKTVIFDEAHNLKDSKSQRGQKALEIVGMGPERLYPLTGTPIADKPLDLFHLLVLLGIRNPDDFYKFRGLYAQMKKKAIWRYNRVLKQREIWKTVQEVVGFKNLELLRKEGERVSSYLKLEQCHTLPPATFIPYYYNLKRDELKEYRSLQGEHGQTLLQWASKASYERVLDLVSRIREESGEKIVIFSNYIETTKELAKLLGAPYLIGGMSSEEIGKEVERFRGASDILCATYKTGGSSLNLQCASYCIMVDLPWYLLEYRQALGRLYRVGQTSKTFYYLLLPRKTIIEEVFGLLDKKYNWTKKVFIEEENFDILRYLEEVKNEARGAYSREGSA
jgi:SNF2 family DNA or RNA helicase